MKNCLFITSRLTYPSGKSVNYAVLAIGTKLAAPWCARKGLNQHFQLEIKQIKLWLEVKHYAFARQGDRKPAAAEENRRGIIIPDTGKKNLKGEPWLLPVRVKRRTRYRKSR